MKNFPHQYVEFPKIRDTLALIAEMSEAGGDIEDDGTLGYALAGRLIYRFRGFDYDDDRHFMRRLEERIAQELRKPGGSQGARTAAREMRRTLQFLMWIDHLFLPTEAGRDLLTTEPGSDEERQALAVALLTAVLADTGVASHPGQILLRLVAEHGPFASRDGMELALEAHDDSEGEFQRISRLLALPTEQRASSMGASATQMANAVKVLPSLALQAGLIAQDPARGDFRITLEGSHALRASSEIGEIGVRPPARRALTERQETHRRVDQETVARRPSVRAAGRTLTPQEQLEAMRLRLERTDRHQDIVRSLARFAGDWQLYEDPLSFDLLMVPPHDPLILWEVKTIAGDAAIQVRAAVGQLLFYEWFFVRPRWERHDVVRSAVFDDDIGEELAEFMNDLRMGALKLDDEGLHALNTTGEEVMRLLPLSAV